MQRVVDVERSKKCDKTTLFSLNLFEAKYLLYYFLYILLYYVLYFASFIINELVPR